MSIQQEYLLTLDLKRQILVANSIPTFVQNDDAVIYVKILDNGKSFNFSDADRYVFSFKLPKSGDLVNGLGSYDTEKQMIKYKLGTLEMSETGNLGTMVQLHFGNIRVSTKIFSIRITEDLENNNPTQEGLTLLQELFIEVDQVKSDTIAAGQFATEQGNFAKGIRDNFGHKGEYDNTKVYKDGNVVSYGGINYMCILETTAGINPLNGTYWTVVSPQATINEQTWTATEGQRTFTLTNGKYVVGKGNIEVVVGGVRQLKDQGYGESSETTITLTEGVPAGTIVYAKWFEGHMYIAKGHQSSHAKGGQDEIDVTQLKNFKEKVTDEITRVDGLLAENAKDLKERGINITQSPFNLVPDGISDDTAKFQEAIDYLQSIGGGKLIIPKMPNPYTMIATNPTISNPKRVLITGDNIHIEGIGKPVIQMKGMSKAYLDTINDQSSSGRDVFTAFSFTRCKNSSIKGIRFEGEWDGTGFFRYISPRAKGVGFLGTTDCLAEDIEGSGILGNLINATPSDVTYDGAYKPLKGITVRNCNANKCLENGFNYMGNTFDGVFEGNIATYCGSTGFEAATTNLIVSNNACSYNKVAGMSISAVNYTVSNNILDSNTNSGESSTAPSAGLLLTAGSNGIISDNIIKNSEGAGLYSYPNLKKIKIKGNIIKDNGTKTSQTMNVNMTGNVANPITDLEFTDNLLENTLSNILYVANFSYVKDAIIRGNNIISNVGLSIYVQGSCDNVLTFNNKVNRSLSISGAAPNCYAYNNQGQSPKLIEMTSLPTIGSWLKGDRIVNVSALSTGGIAEWRCTTSGVASNVSWVASTLYSVGSIVNTGNKVYKATVAGTSGTTAPSHTSGTATDGSVTWEYLGALAKFDVSAQAGVLTSIASAPVFIGQVAVASGIAYIATGISTAADWKQITN